MDQLQLLSLGGNLFSGELPAAWGGPAAFPLLVSMDLNGSSLTGDHGLSHVQRVLCCVNPMTPLYTIDANEQELMR